MDLPPEFKKVIEEMTDVLNTARLPIHIAAALLPLEKEIQEELQHWHDGLPLQWELNNHPRPEVFVSVASDLSRLTWHTTGDMPEFYQQFKDYLEDYSIAPGNLHELDEVVTSVNPAQLGVWISAQKGSFELGWYCVPPEGLFENAKPLLPQCEQLEQISSWAEKYDIKICPRFGRSLITEDQLSELFLVVDAETPRRSLEIALILMRHLGLDYPADKVLAALLSRDPAEVVVSLWFGLSGLAKFGIMLGDPPAVQFLRLNDAAGHASETKIAMFEGCLGVNQIEYLEYQILGSGENVEMHYAIR